jgi:phosphohistidine swiveling domain-containing protein
MTLSYLGDPRLAAESVSGFGGKAQKLHELLLSGFPVPPGLVLVAPAAVTAAAVDALGGFPVAVRSSGSLEDLGGASFAGQYETFLDVNSLSELEARIRECFASRDSARVRDYLATRGIAWTPESLKMSVLVQRMVPAVVAGVLFTINPLKGHEEEMYVECCAGLGERLVSGHVTPTAIVYDWREGRKLRETVNAEGTTITDAQLAELVDLAARIQAHYGTPQDIEWAIGPDGKVSILQSRPVTTFAPRTDVPELTNADFKDGGVSARVCTPFMFSVYRDALQYSMGDYLKKVHLITNDEGTEWIYYHYGRVYWNAGAVKNGLKKLPDFKEADFDRDIGVQKDYGAAGPAHTPVTLATLVGAIPVLIGINKEYIDCRNMIRLFRTRFELADAALKERLPELARLPAAAFIDWFGAVLRFQNETERNYFRTIYNNSNYQTEFKSYLKKLPGYEDGDEVDLMSELHGVAHLDVQAGLAKLSAAASFYGFESETYHRARETFLRDHYHHGPAELDLRVPRWGERKDWVDDLVRSYCPAGPAGESRYRGTFERIRRRLGPLTRGTFERRTEASREFLRLREELRSYSTRAYYLLRLGLLEFARRRGLDEDDAFMLDVTEIRRSLAGLALPDTTHRRRFYEGYRNFTPPNEFGGSITAATASVSGDLRGVGCSPGELTGRARVILDIHQTGSLTKEDILVTAFTDPGWTPVLARVGGVITEVGGLLSHAAVIGREYRIPAILNLIGATKLIADGDLIRINGKTGLVEVLEKCPDR